MNYLLFNNEVIISNGQAIKKIERDDLKENFDHMGKARICYVDVDVMIASAPEDYSDKKDRILTEKFVELYSNEYITLDEKIDSNLFQVIGIKSEKVKEIYSLIPSSKVDAFVPYAIAIRVFLVNRQVDMTRPIVFIDDLGHEKLITVFEGLKFSRTRTIYTTNAEDILSDIKRSFIDFNKKLGGFAGNKPTGDLILIIDNKKMAEDIQSLDPGLAIEFLDCRYPALEGLRFIDSQIKYRVHEEIILECKKKELHSRLMYLTVSIGICLAGVLFFGFNQIVHSFVTRDFMEEKFRNYRLKNELNEIDQYIYRDFLRKSKNLNYSNIFFDVSVLLPSTYEISSFKFTGNGDHWIFDTFIFAQDDQFYDEIPKIKILKKSEIKDFFIKNRPGKYLKITL